MAHNTGNNTLRVELKHRGYNAILDFFIAGDDKHYSDSTTYLTTEDEEETYGPTEDTWKLESVPNSWLQNLQNDMSAYLSYS